VSVTLVEGWTALMPIRLKAADAFGLSAFPYFVAVDGSGKVVARTTGEITTDEFTNLAAKSLGNR